MDYAILVNYFDSLSGVHLENVSPVTLQPAFESIIISVLYKKTSEWMNGNWRYLSFGEINPKVNSDWPSTQSTKTFNLVPPQRGYLVTTSPYGGQQSPLIPTLGVSFGQEFEPRTSSRVRLAESSKTVAMRVWHKDRSVQKTEKLMFI